MATKLGLKLKQWGKRSWKRKIYDVFLYAFALAGAAILGAWAIFQLGLTNNKGGVDENYRYLLSVEEMQGIDTIKMSASQLNKKWAEQYVRMAVFSRYYPENARLILEGAMKSDNPMLVERMVAAAELYVDNNDDYVEQMQTMLRHLQKVEQHDNGNLIPWMNTVEWGVLKEAIVKDSALINEAGRLCDVEPRLIAGCLIGEQIRLFNSKREMYKKYLGPVKTLSVQSQFSYGVNGIKEFTAIAVEDNLKDKASPYYMGERYEHLLDYPPEADKTMERYKRLVDYRNHLYSYLYTGCILRQTMLQWRRAGYDISNRPDILFTLFNVGFSQSEPKANPVCGGSHITVNDRVYTFGAIGFDFYYSGELANAFPYWKTRFPDPAKNSLTTDEIVGIQENMSDCNRPEKGLEYKQQPAAFDGYEIEFAPRSSDEFFMYDDDSF